MNRHVPIVVGLGCGVDIVVMLAWPSALVVVGIIIWWVLEMMGLPSLSIMVMVAVVLILVMLVSKSASK